MEQWLGARVGSSRCCPVCGGSECRTVEIGTATFEAIPQELFLKAAFDRFFRVVGAQSGSAVAQKVRIGAPGLCRGVRGVRVVVKRLSQCSGKTWDTSAGVCGYFSRSEGKLREAAGKVVGLKRKCT